MKKLALLLIIFFASCETPTTGVSEADSQTFEKNVQTIKDTWIQGYEQENFDQAVSFMADSIQWHAPAGGAVGIESLKRSVQYWMDNF